MNRAGGGGGAVQRAGAGPHLRKMLFYSVCLWVRILLVILLLLLIGSDEKQLEVPISIALAVVLALVAVGNAVKSVQPGVKNVWWKRRVHAAFLGVAAVLACVSATIPGKRVYLAVGGVLATDVLFGFVHSLVRRPFDDETR